jgi:hypothetical protein
VVDWSVNVKKWSVEKWSEGLRNKVSIIIRTYSDHMNFTAYMALLFITFFSYSIGSIFYHCIYNCMFVCISLNFVNYAYLFLCMFPSGYSVSFCCFVYCWCVNVYCTTVTGCQPKCSWKIYMKLTHWNRKKLLVSQCTNSKFSQNTTNLLSIKVATIK